MASVRISDKLVSETRDAIRTMRDAEQRRTPSVPSEISVLPNDERVVRRYILDHERDAYRIVPKNWLEDHDTLALHLSIELAPAQDGKEAPVLRQEFTLRPPSGNKFYLPHSRYSRYSSSARMEAAFKDNAWPEAQAFVTKACSDYEVRQRWDKIESQVVEFLRQYPSLNAAVKAWPGVKLYIPKNYIDALERKVERSKVEVSTTGLNFDELTAAAVAHRMGV
jgi:hypothetical protein